MTISFNETILVSLFIWNIFVFFIYAFDKYKSRRNQWRVEEFILLWLAFLGGGFGAFCGMFICHHKTNKVKFKILVPLAVFCNLILFIYLFG